MKKINELEKGKIYWKPYFEFSKQGNRFKTYVGIISVKFIKRYCWNEDYKFMANEYEFLDLDTTERIAHNLKSRLKNAQPWYELCESREEAIKKHDSIILKHIEGMRYGVVERRFLEKKLINSSCSVSKIEVETKQWIETLNDQQKEYLDWIIHNS